MRYFKLNNEIYAYSADQEYLITAEMKEIKGKELEALLNPPVPPRALTPLTSRQFKLALLDAGLLDDVEDAIEAIEDNDLKRRIKIEHEYATQFERGSDSIAVMAKLIGLDSDAVDALWRQALTL